MSSAALENLTSWHSPWSGLRAVVIGLGHTGFAIVDTLCELGCDVTVIAAEAAPDIVKLSEVVGARVIVDSDDTQRHAALEGLDPDFAVVSPGVAPTDPVVVQLSQAGVPVLSDLNLAWRLRDKSGEPAEWILVQHSGDSDTTVGLAQRIFQAASHPTRVVGFQAPPLLDALREPRPYSALIIQVSPASLVWKERFPDSPVSPRVTVSWGEGSPAESGVFFDGTTLACVYRKGLGPSESQVADADVVEGARAIGIGLDSPGMSDIGVVEGIIVDRAFLEDRANQALEISTVDELAEAGWDIPGDIPAILAAVAIARSRDVEPALIAGVLSLP